MGLFGTEYRTISVIHPIFCKYCNKPGYLGQIKKFYYFSCFYIFNIKFFGCITCYSKFNVENKKKCPKCSNKILNGIPHCNECKEKTYYLTENVINHFKMKSNSDSDTDTLKPEPESHDQEESSITCHAPKDEEK